MERRRGSLIATASVQGGSVDNDFYNPNPNYLTIVALEDGLTASLSTNDVEYSIDGNDNWTTLSAGTASPAINTGQYISFRGNLTPDYDKGIGTFTINKSCDLTGNCNSLLFGDDAADNLDLTDKNHAFRSLFAYCSTIKNVSSNFLSATTLASRCYDAMFYWCSSLITAPELPATTLTDSCYTNMFYNCYSLITAPKLPATTLANNCYLEMFLGCSSLAAAPKLPATTLTEYCYFKMFYGTKVLPDCSNINFSSSTVVASGGLCGLFGGTKVTDSDLRNILPINSNGKYYLPVTKLVDGCYSQMFYGCGLLTTAPELPATTLAEDCYNHMFNNCSLTIAPALPATTLAEYCYYGMFWNCTSLTTAPELPATTLKRGCYGYMFHGCRSLTAAPGLPATTLGYGCYDSMFYGCSKLNYIKAMFTTTPSDDYTEKWVYNVASTGTFIKNKNATWNVTGSSGIPSGWTVVFEDIFTPQECLNLSITAANVSGRKSTTTVYYTATVKGLDVSGNTITKTITDTDTIEIGQNTSTTNSVTKTVSYTYMGVTATTTITQGPWVDSSYTVNPNFQWQTSSKSNPDSTMYDIYESYSNKGTGNSGASMYINIDGYTNFKLYIRSYAESNYDYVMVSQLDKTLTYSSSYSDTTLVKAHTKGNQQSGTALSNYTLVEFTNIDGGAHTIQIIYRKDGSVDSNDDRGYVLIPKNQ